MTAALNEMPGHPDVRLLARPSGLELSSQPAEAVRAGVYGAAAGTRPARNSDCGVRREGPGNRWHAPQGLHGGNAPARLIASAAAGRQSGPHQPIPRASALPPCSGRRRASPHSGALTSRPAAAAAMWRAGRAFSPNFYEAHIPPRTGQHGVGSKVPT